MNLKIIKKMIKVKKAFLAIRNGDFDSLRKEVEKGFDVNSKSNDFRHTALQEACLCNNFDIAQYLIKCGADVNVCDEDETSPLHLAVIMQNLKICELFIKQGADVNKLDLEGNTPLHESVSYGNLEIFTKLVNSGADVKLYLYGDDGLIARATRWENFKVLDFLRLRLSSNFVATC
jgi:ankyrin repeat protein